MMKFLRKEGVMKVILWIIAVVIVASFGLLSNAYLLQERGAGPRHAGSLFNKPVPLAEFKEHLQFIDASLYLKFQADYKTIRPQLNLIEQTWDRLMLLHEAKKRGLKVTKPEIIDAIKQMPPFLKNNTFSEGLYRTILKNNLQISPLAFETGVQQDILIEKLLELETLGLSVNDDELAAAYTKARQQAQVRYILFPTERYLGEVTYNEAQVKNYFLNHKKDFLKPPAMRIHYVTFPVPENAGEETKASVYASVITTHDRLMEGESLSDIAAKDGLTIEETGFIDPATADIALGWDFETLQNLYTSRDMRRATIVETPAGYQVLQIKNRRDAYLPGFDEVADEARQAWTRNEALIASGRHAEATRALLLEKISAGHANGAAFKTAAAALGLEVQETPLFTYGEYLPIVGQSVTFHEAVFMLSDDKPISDPVETPKGFCLIHRSQLIPVDPERFTQEADGFREMILREKQNRAIKEYILKLRALAQPTSLINDEADR